MFSITLVHPGPHNEPFQIRIRSKNGFDPKKAKGSKRSYVSTVDFARFSTTKNHGFQRGKSVNGKITVSIGFNRFFIGFNGFQSPYISAGELMAFSATKKSRFSKREERKWQDLGFNRF